MSRGALFRSAVVLGAAATTIALACALAGVTPLDGWAYARWRPPALAAPAVVVVTADEGRAPDDAALARLVGRLARGGAEAIALDPPPRDARARSAPGAEALLRQTLADTDRVVLTADAAAALPHPRLGHLLGGPGAGVAAVALHATVDGRRVPALGAALVAVATGTEIDAGFVALDGHGRVLFPAGGVLSRVSLDALIGPAGDGDAALQSVAAGRIVLIAADPARAPGVVLQGELASALLAHATLGAAPPALVWAATLALAVLAAWLGLARRWPIAAVNVLGLALATAGSVGLALRLGVVAPLTVPLVGIVTATGGALAWRHVADRRRLGRLEREMGTVREALARQESTVEMLEEDLEAARAAVERSAGTERELVRAAEALRAQLGEARAQEQETRRRLQAFAAESRPAPPPDEPDPAAARVGILTRDPGVLALFRDLEKAARSSLPILITGEPGTGKELFARAAHRLGSRAAQPFVAVNMAAIPPELFESELFGHVRGSFTGAVADRKGWFEQADRGTIFLDEIGELRADHQSKLLRVLQERTFYRVGATRPTSVDVRVVAATNRDLERGVAEGWFREDLYFRLKGLVLALPPLRARRGDIALLSARSLADAAAEVKRPGLVLSRAAMAALEAYAWPGNVRELQNCLRRAVALADGEVLGPADLRLPAAGRGIEPEPRDSDTLVLEALRRHRFDMQATARELGWDRSTVTQRLKGLGFRALVDAGGDAARAAAALAGEPVLARTVETKLREYQAHLLRTVAAFDSADAAVAACRRRFKNLPERHFRSLESLVRQAFA
jgi:DNA-binding NtrC family response regulator/CHASE2 domain-containing sensor protein